MKIKVKISVIVPVWNHLEDLTKPFLESLLACNGDFEVVLVDNGSSDGTKEYFQKFKHKKLFYIRSEKNRGFGGGNNLGYEFSAGKEICFLSNDVIINDPDFLLKFSEVLKGKTALLGSMLVDWNQLTVFNKKTTPYIAGWCMYGSKKMFDEVKSGKEVFDEQFNPAYFEDVWLSQQCVDAGYELLEVPLKLEHLVSKSSDQINIPVQAEISQSIFRSKMMYSSLQKQNKKRIVFLCPGVPYGFIDDDYEGKGVGGAEGSLILLSRELVKKGYKVEIYNRTQVVGEYNGVEYHHLNEFKVRDYCDVFVLYRAFHPAVHYVNSVINIFWSCDQYTDGPGIWESQIFPYVDGIVGISPFHIEFLEEHYSKKKHIEKLTCIDLGINYEDYDKKVEKIPGKAIFCSVPMRGLERLALIAPKIKEKIPEFNLVITSDYRLWGLDDPTNQEFKEMFRELDYVDFVGKISRKELVQHQLESVLMTYPCTYDECFCISAMECMAAGAVPVTCDVGALRTTIGTGGVLLSNSVSESKYVESVVDLFNNAEKLAVKRDEGKRIAEKHDWSIIIDEWLLLIKQLERR